jgi:hypothetical protein
MTNTTFVLFLLHVMIAWSVEGSSIISVTYVCYEGGLRNRELCVSPVSFESRYFLDEFHAHSLITRPLVKFARYDTLGQFLFMLHLTWFISLCCLRVICLVELPSSDMFHCATFERFVLFVQKINILYVKNVL